MSESKKMTRNRMHTIPGAFFQRELGNPWPRHSVDYKSQMRCMSYDIVDDCISLIDEMNALNDWDPNTTRPEHNPVYSMEFSPILPDVLAVSDEIGGITLMHTHQSNINKVVAYNRLIQNAIFKVAWSTHRDNVIATASSNQTVDVWDVNTDFTNLATYTGHSKTVKMVRFHPNRPECLVSAGRDGCIMMWDLRDSSATKPSNLIYKAHHVLMPIKYAFDLLYVISLLFRLVTTSGSASAAKKRMTEVSLPVTDILLKDDEYTLISCGASDGLIKFWDIRRTYNCLATSLPVNMFQFPRDRPAKGYSGMCLDSTNNLYTSTTGHYIFKYNLSSESREPVQCFERDIKTNTDYSMNLGISGDNRYLISASAEAYAYIWDTLDETPKHCAVISEGDRPHGVCCTLFNPNDPLQVVTGCDDSFVTIWRVDPLKFVKKEGQRMRADAEVHLDLAPIIPPFEGRLTSLLPKYRRSLAKCDSNLQVNESDLNATFNLSPLLNDLPNFVVNGIQPHLTPKVDKLSTPDRMSLASWLQLHTEPSSGEKRMRTDSSDSVTPSKRLKVKNSMTPTPPSKKNKASPRSSKATTPKSRKVTKKRRLSLSLTTSPGNQNTVPPGPSVNSPSILKYFTPVNTQSAVAPSLPHAQ